MIMALDLSCKDCGKAGFYLISIFSGRGQWNYCSDGSIDDNSSYWDSCNVKSLKTAHCQQCDKSLKRLTEDEILMLGK